jgi:hypothetical protein
MPLDDFSLTHYDLNKQAPKLLQADELGNCKVIAGQYKKVQVEVN